MPLTTTSAPRQLSDNNAVGTCLGTGPTDLIAFYNNVGGIPQPSDNSQAALSRGQGGGVIASFSTTQSPSAVTANTTVASSETVQSGSGASLLAATTDLAIFNRAASQAGLGTGNTYIASSNTISQSFCNFTSGSLTPTASEVHKVVLLRGMPTISATLSPAAVAANATVEQQFTVTGLPAGTLVFVTKPSNQAGLDIAGMRVVSNNLLGITFVNVTASPITPTAAESYTVYAVAGLDAVNNDVNYEFNVGTVGAIGAGLVVSGGNTTLTGVLATDVVTGIAKPTSGAAATNAAYPVLAIPTANTMTLYFAGIGTGATPTASEVYQITTKRLAPVAPLLLYKQVLAAPVSVAANTTAEQTFTVTGLVAGTPVWINKPSWQNGLGIMGVRVSAANTLAVTYTNSTSAAITPATETYTIGNFQVPSPGAGNCVYQSASPVLDKMALLTNAVRTALVNLGLIAGA